MLAPELLVDTQSGEEGLQQLEQVPSRTNAASVLGRVRMEEDPGNLQLGGFGFLSPVVTPAGTDASPRPRPGAALAAQR